MSVVFETVARGGFTASAGDGVDRTRTDLCVEREDIQFYNVAPDRLRIEVTVHNRGNTPSRPSNLQLQFAAFGAFVPWTPLQGLRVPQIRAGRSRLVSTDALIRADGSLVAADGVAQSADRDLSARESATTAWRNALRGFQDPQGNDSRRFAPTALNWPDSLRSIGQRMNPDPGTESRPPHVDVLQGRSVHWVGNINVLIGDLDVERHKARAFRIHPGRANRSVFILGDQADESYSFGVEGSGAAWPTKLTHIGYHSARLSRWARFATGWDCPGEQIQSGDWLRVGPLAEIGVEICPPEEATEGGIAIEVCRRSDRRRAVVEFDFSATAAGPGCYTVDGR